MTYSDPLVELDETLRQAGDSGHQLRLYLLRHFSELLRQLACNLDAGNLEAGAPEESTVESSTDAAEQVPAPSVLSLSEYGDEATLHKVRMEALEVFDTRRFDGEEYVTLWVDVCQLWGRPFLLCMAATLDGDRHVLGFVESSTQELASVRGFFQGLLDRGLSLDRGLLCITPGTARLCRVLTECFGQQIRLQHCQMHKRARVISYLAVPEQRLIQGAMTRAFAIPDLALARASLLQIHVQLQKCNRSAAQWLLRDLDLSLTLHHSGVYDRLSRSLRSTRCIVHVVQQLNRRLRGVRHWLAPTSRRAQFALLLLETEMRMRRLAHASYLSIMRAALFAEDSDQT